MKRICVLMVVQLFLAGLVEAQLVYPTHWWVGMKDSKLQLVIRTDKEITGTNPAFRSSSPDVRVIKVVSAENKHFLFVDLQIAGTAKPQKVKFTFGTNSINYELKAKSKENGKTRVQGVTSKDFTYLIMPISLAG